MFLLFHAGRYPSQNFHFYICDTLKLPFFVSCWQVSDVRKKKKGMVNDVSVSNISYESIIWCLDTINLTPFQYFTDIWRDKVNGDQSKGENDIYLGLAYMTFFIFFINLCLWIFCQTCNEISSELLVDVSADSVEAWIFLFISHSLFDHLFMRFIHVTRGRCKWQPI